MDFVDYFGAAVGILTIPLVAKIISSLPVYLFFYWGAFLLGIFASSYRILYYYSFFPCLLSIWLIYHFYTTDKYSWELGRQVTKKELLKMNYERWRNELSQLVK